MKVYKCRITGDEMFTDSCQIETRDGFYVLKGKYVTRKDDMVVDTGANPSAEDAGEDDGDCEAVSGIDIVMDNRLQATCFNTKKEYQFYMKDYMKDVLQRLEGKVTDDELAKLKADTGKSFKEACSKFDDLQFFTGASSNPSGHIALVEWVETEVDCQKSCNPVVYFYKLGIIEEKY